MLCGGRGLADELLALAAVALAGWYASGRGQDDAWIMAQIHTAAEGALQEGGRRVRRPDSEPPLALQGCQRSASGRDRQGDQRLRRGGRARCCRSHQAGAAEGQAGRRLRRLARRRQDRVRLLDLLRLLQRGGQQHGAPRQVRSGRYRSVLEVGVLLARQSPHPLQSRLRRSSGQGLGSQAEADRMGRRQVGRVRRARHRADGQAGGGAAFHHEPRRHGSPVGSPDDEGRPVPGALRALREPDREPDRRQDWATRRRACSRATWRCSAMPRSSRMPLSPTG